jgi:uroporphyrinogen III methyltransferase / synthase
MEVRRFSGAGLDFLGRMTPHLPLENKIVVVTASELKSTRLSAGLARLGARVIPFPTIKIQEISDTNPLDASLDVLEAYAWIIFTSSYGAHYFFRRLTERGIPMERLRNPKVCGVGPATAAALMEAGVEVHLIPDDFVAEGVVRALTEFHGGLEHLAGRYILIPRAKEGRDVLPRALESAGARVDVVACYESVLPEVEESILNTLLNQVPDLIVFTSSLTVSNFVKLMGDAEGKRVLRTATVAALGPITARTVESLGKQPEIQARENTTESLLEAIAEYYGSG